MEERFEKFTTLIAKISRNIKKIKNREMSRYALKSAHISCLYYLYTEGELTPKDLTERCEEDKATISRSLEYLEKEGYLICGSKSEKKYKMPIVLTEKGQTFGKTIADKIDRVLDTVSVGLSEEERLEFYRSLTIVSDALEAIRNRAEEI